MTLGGSQFKTYICQLLAQRECAHSPATAAVAQFQSAQSLVMAIAQGLGTPRLKVPKIQENKYSSNSATIVIGLASLKII